MRKLPDWLQQDEALAASSKSHQYLQMNINSLRRLLGKMKQTTPAFKAKSSSWMRLVYFVCLAILITLSHSTIQLWILAIFLLAHIAFLPPSLEGPHACTHFHGDCALTKYSFKRLPKQRHLPWSYRNPCLKPVAFLSNNDKCSTR